MQLNGLAAGPLRATTGAARATTAAALAAIIALGAVTFDLVAPQEAVASEQSTRLVSRGLVRYHAGDVDGALAAFSQASDADSSDAEAWYYRGLAHGKLGHYAQAVADLERARSLRPDLARVDLELGYALFELERYDDARDALERAAAQPSLAAQASLFLGIIGVRTGDTAAARSQLERAAADPQLAAAARYYLGVSELRDGRTESARQQLEWVAASAPETDLGRDAERRLATMRSDPDSAIASARALGTGERGARAGVAARGEPAADRNGGAEDRRYRLHGSVGFQYDSNVVLAPSDGSLADAVGITDQSDGRAVFDAGIRYDVVREPNVRVSAGYDFFQSLHFDLSEFDLQDHRLSLDGAARLGRAIAGLATRYDYYLVDDSDPFLGELSASPWVRIPFGALGETDVYYRFRDRSFEDSPFDDLRDGQNHAAGIRHAYYFAGRGAGAGGGSDAGGAHGRRSGAAARERERERYVAIGYRYDHEEPDNADGELFGYDGHEGSIELGWALPAGVDGLVAYAYRAEDYDPGPSNGRDDDEHLFSLVVGKQLTELVRLEAGYGGNLNDSDRDVFEYDRHVGSVALRVRY